MKPFLTRRTAVMLGLVLVLGVVLFSRFWKEPAMMATDEPITGLPLVAQAQDPVGEVTLVRNEQEQPLTDDMLLEEGDVVRTGQQGTVSLELFAGSRVALDAQTEVQFTALSIDPANQRLQRVNIALHGGRIWNRILKLLEADSGFEVHSTTLAATVRGTAFAMTSFPGTAGSPEQLDLFEGAVHIAAGSGEVEGIMEPGFSFVQGLGNREQPFAAHLSPTSDGVRNDPFLRAQLRADAAFLNRIKTLRERLGDTESYRTLGQEAGPFTLDQEGVTHSGYVSLELAIDRPNAPLLAGESARFRAIAYFESMATGTAAITQDVTRQALWQLSDPSLASLENGVLTAKPDARGTAIIVARWNDGTHEHSGSFLIPIGTPE